LSSCREKQALLDDAEACKKKMSAASALISGLSGERVRWTAQSKEFKAQIGKTRLRCLHILLIILSSVMQSLSNPDTPGLSHALAGLLGLNSPI